MKITDGDHRALKFYCMDRGQVKGTAIVLLETPLKRDLSSRAIVVGARHIHKWWNMDLFEQHAGEGYAWYADCHHAYGFLFDTPRVDACLVMRVEDFGGPGVQVFDGAEAIRCTLEDLVYAGVAMVLDEDGDRRYLDCHRNSPEYSVAARFFDWTLPLED